MDPNLLAAIEQTLQGSAGPGSPYRQKQIQQPALNDLVYRGGLDPNRPGMTQTLPYQPPANGFDPAQLMTPTPMPGVAGVPDDMVELVGGTGEPSALQSAIETGLGWGNPMGAVAGGEPYLNGEIPQMPMNPTGDAMERFVNDRRHTGRRQGARQEVLDSVQPPSEAEFQDFVRRLQQNGPTVSEEQAKAMGFGWGGGRSTR